MASWNRIAQIVVFYHFGFIIAPSVSGCNSLSGKTPRYLWQRGVRVWFGDRLLRSGWLPYFAANFCMNLMKMVAVSALVTLP